MNALPTDLQIDRSCVFSPDRLHRYTLWREFDLTNRSYVQFVGLNPSTADEVQDDPTVRRCIDFAKRWGYGALCMTNLFAYRATDPDDMLAAADPVGPENDMWLARIAAGAGLVVAAWGNHGGFIERDRAVATLLPQLMCLGITKTGAPRHPLYVKAITTPTTFALQA
jgi:hypothetical protein